MSIDPHTHQYGEDDEAEDNRHEFGVLPHHGMSDAAMRAMFAKQRGAISGSGAKTGKTGGGGANRFQSRANEKVLQAPKPVKQVKNPLTGKAPTSTSLKAPDVKKFTVKPGTQEKMMVKKPSTAPLKQVSKTAPVTKSHAKPHKDHKEDHKGGDHKGGHKKGGHEGGHSPLHIMKKIGAEAKNAAHETVKASVAAAGAESTLHEVKAGAKGHKFGDPDGRHEDR